MNRNKIVKEIDANVELCAEYGVALANNSWVWRKNMKNPFYERFSIVSVVYIRSVVHFINSDVVFLSEL